MEFGLINHLNGTPIIIVPTRKIQNRTLKKKRINKKWAKRYGFTISETLKNGETYMMDGKLYMNQHTYTQLKTSIEFENLLKRQVNQVGLDFGIEKRRKGENYKGLAFEDCCSWRNCHEVKRIFSETIEFNDEYYYPITIGAMQILIKKLSDELQKVDFNKIDEVDEYRVNKLLCAIEDLSKIISDAIWDYQDGIEYEYRVFDSF